MPPQAHPELRDWCNDTTLRRYLAARSFNVAQAKKMLLHTLEWRVLLVPSQQSGGVRCASQCALHHAAP